MHVFINQIIKSLYHPITKSSNLLPLQYLSVDLFYFHKKMPHHHKLPPILIFPPNKTPASPREETASLEMPQDHAFEVSSDHRIMLGFDSSYRPCLPPPLLLRQAILAFIAIQHHRHHHHHHHQLFVLSTGTARKLLCWPAYLLTNRPSSIRYCHLLVQSLQKIGF